MQTQVFTRAHLTVALAIFFILGIANTIVFRSLEGAIVTSLGPLLPLYDLPNGRVDWEPVHWQLLGVVGAVLAFGVAFQFLGRARSWSASLRLGIWALAWAAWCVSGDLALFARMG